MRDSLTIEITEKEIWDEDNEEFIYVQADKFEIVHSLYSISVWEAKYHKPFLSTDKTIDETLDYVTMMNVSDHPIDIESLKYLTAEQLKDIKAYIDNKMTATWFSEDYDDEGKPKKQVKKKGKKEEILTNELLYYYMTALNIPFECEMWHLSRLITLIRVCSIKNQPDDKKKKKMTTSELELRRAQMEARRAKYHTNG